MIDAWGWGTLSFVPGAVDALAGTPEAVEAPQSVLSPFGTLFTTVAWLVLVGLHLWCFRRLVAAREVLPETPQRPAGEP